MSDQKEIYLVHVGLPGCLPNSSTPFMDADDADQYAEEQEAEIEEEDGPEIVDCAVLTWAEALELGWINEAGEFNEDMF